MKSPVVSVLSFTILVLLAISCNNDDDKVLPVLPGSCILQAESTDLSGNQASWTYEYDTDGNLVKIDRANSYGTPSSFIEIGDYTVKNSAIVGPAVPQSVTTIRYEGEAITGRPTRAFVSSLYDGNESINYKTFFFFYDEKGRLNLVGEQTDNVVGDLEWDLHITYNDQDNVTSLYYEITTGPNIIGTSVTVDAYDNKPSPYTGIPSWKYIMNNFAWDNYDPEPVISALSKNNAIDYALNKGTAGEYLRTMTYEYNSEGYPTKRINTNKNASGEYTFTQTYTYTCL